MRSRKETTFSHCPACSASSARLSRLGRWAGESRRNCFQRTHPALEVAQLLGRPDRRLVQERVSPRRLGREARLHTQGLDRALEAPRSFGAPRDRVQRAEVRRRTLQDALVRGQRAFHVAEPVFEHRAEPEEPGGGLPVVWRAIDGACVEVGQLAPPPRRRVQPGQRPERRVVVRVEGERPRVMTGGVVVLAVPVEERAHPVLEAGLLRGVGDGLGAGRQHPQELGVLLALLVAADEGEGGRGVRRIGAQRALVPGPRAVAVPEHLLEGATETVAESRPAPWAPRSPR